MTPEKYKAIMSAIGGFTKDAKRGDHPQPLTKEDDAALSRAWKAVRNSRASLKKVAETSQAATPVKVKS